MNRRQNEHFFQISIVTLLCAYAIIGNNAINFNLGWFPTFKLSYFTKAPDVVSHYTLRFTEINGEMLDEPVYFDQAGAWIENRKIADGEELINQLGIALHADDEVHAADLHARLIKEYFYSLDSAEYEILFLVVNPVEKYSLNSFTAEQHIGAFVYDGMTQAFTTSARDFNY